MLEIILPCNVINIDQDSLDVDSSIHCKALNIMRKKHKYLNPF